MRLCVAFVTAAMLGAVANTAQADIVPRTSPAAGSVIARKIGEEVRFIDIGDWRAIDLSQDLVPGDVLRTNAQGNLAVLFTDRTQMRLARNTTLIVKQIGSASDTLLGLEAGEIWARAERGGLGLTVDTPAASAAIRGTDFSLRVGADGLTSLIVLEGDVQLLNEFGSVAVGEGEAAVAAIGQAPTKIIIVAPKDREQMLFHVSLRGAFASLPPVIGQGAQLRAEHRTIAASVPSKRSAEDWIALAEYAQSFEGPKAARAALDAARPFADTPQLIARLDYVEGLLLGQERRYEDAARLLSRAMPHLDAERRGAAAYAAYFARSLGNPSLVEQPPIIEPSVTGALAQAFTAGFLQDIPAAIAVLKAAEAQFPGSAVLPATRAELAMLLDDRKEVRQAITRALEIDPDDPSALHAAASFEAGFEGRVEQARVKLEQALVNAPGASSIWNTYGLIESARGADREAEAALRRSIELDPLDPVGHANLAIVLLDQDRLAEAKYHIDLAIELDPAFDIALVARGRYRLQTGDIEGGLKDLLSGSTANPAYAQGLLMLAAGYYESGELDAAAQALENADRLDPNDPVTASFETAIAIDDYDAQRAIDSAQEALRRSRARGGDYAAVSANRDAGSLLNNAFRLQGMDAWGRFYGDVVFDPFSGSALVDQAVSGSPSPLVTQATPGADPVEPIANSDAFSALFQGLLLSPEMISGRSRSANLLRRPFLEGSIGGGGIRTAGDGGLKGEAELQGFAAYPFPVSFYGRIESTDAQDTRERTAPSTLTPFVRFGLEDSSISGTSYLTARPTASDRVVAFAEFARPQSALTDAIVLLNDPLIPFSGIAYERDITVRQAKAGLGWSHTFAHRNVLNAAFFASSQDQTSREAGLLFDAPTATLLGSRDLENTSKQQTYLGAISHTLGVGAATWRYGAEAGVLDASQSEQSVTTLGPFAPIVELNAGDIDVRFARAYADLVYDVTPDLKVEGAVFATGLSGSLETASIEPRAGVAWSPFDGHWLRAGYVRQSASVDATTLAPIGVVGLQANQFPLEIDGKAETLGLRWDAQWTERLFTSLDYQHQEFSGLSLPLPAALDTIDLAAGSFDRLAATANLHLGHGLGVFGTIAQQRSRNDDPLSPGFGALLPYVPELAGRVGMTYVHPSNLKFTLAGTYVGTRISSEVGDPLPSYWSADAFLTFEPFDKRLALEIAAYNLLDEEFDVAPATPGWGRTVVGSLKFRF
ncbi:MAG: TonB-dependent receptor domain-containing protein [Neoaquamicrobium sediminum]|uniref:TonB-dependent receptor domain-containing protein n=1 Tax=Neoaquamicrobium sediminum TaxID=1849104 RepID=UPI00403846DD